MLYIFSFSSLLSLSPSGKSLKLYLSIFVSIKQEENVIEKNKERAQWTNGLEFLMSCVAFSVGLGNVWRFPYTAYENGGGAFLIPYIIVLFVIGKPFYYMEMILGQFTSSSCVQIWSVSPLFQGISQTAPYLKLAHKTSLRNQETR